MASNGGWKWAPAPTINPSNPLMRKWDNGLILHENFISPGTEAAIISEIEANAVWKGAGRRQTLHFGPHFDYVTLGASETEYTPVPSFLSDLLPQLPLFKEPVGGTPAEKKAYVPDQFTVQYYPPGTGIPPHVDTHSPFREALYCLSLGSQVPMVFKRCGEKEAMRIRQPKRWMEALSEKASPSNVTQQSSPETGSTVVLDRGKPTSQDTDLQAREGTNTPDNEEAEEQDQWGLMLPPRSLLIMTGPSRYGWTHKIRGRKFDTLSDGTVVERKGRYSITMRTVVRDGTPCACDFPGVCDTRLQEERRRM